MNTQNKSRVVLLACGSFNPITNMHLRMFELARDFLHNSGMYQVVGGIISPVSDGYGKTGLITSKHRCAMVERAIQTNEWIRLDTWECDQPTWTETAKVLHHHQNFLDSIVNSIKSSPSKNKKQKLDYDQINANTVRTTNYMPTWDLSNFVQVKLLCGADLLESFGVLNLWKDEDIADIVGNFGLVVITREGSNPQRFIYESDLLTKYQNNIYLVTEWITNDVSSTRIRRALMRGESVKYLVQDSVIQYIKEHKLYQALDIKYPYLLTPSPNFEEDILRNYESSYSSITHFNIPSIHQSLYCASENLKQRGGLILESDQETAV